MDITQAYIRQTENNALVVQMALLDENQEQVAFYGLNTISTPIPGLDIVLVEALGVDMGIPLTGTGAKYLKVIAWGTGVWGSNTHITLENPQGGKVVYTLPKGQPFPGHPGNERVEEVWEIKEPTVLSSIVPWVLGGLAALIVLPRIFKRRGAYA